MKAKIDFYTKVHKGLRAGLFAVSEQAATTDFADGGAVNALAAAARDIFERLGSHAAHEDRFIDPLLVAKLGESPFVADHIALERDQVDLARRIAEINALVEEERRAAGLAFYRALNRFVASYLAHIDREEETMHLLWERCTDAELAGVMARFGASRPLRSTLADIGWMLPALSKPEQAELIGGMSAALCDGPASPRP